MIIDAHCHCVDRTWHPSWFWDALKNALTRRYGISAEQMAVLIEGSWDPSGDTMINAMDTAGVDKAIVCISDFGLTKHGEENPTPIEEINRLTAEMIRRHSGRLYFAAGADPRRKNALEIIETGVKEWGAVSVKLQPAAGWYPNDRMVYPVYEKCVELGVPVNFHTGPWHHPMKSKYTYPTLFDEVAADFPKLTILCTHSGDLFFHEMVSLARMYPNIVLDLAGWQGWLRASRPTVISFYKTMRFMIDMVGPRLVFASDWGGFPEATRYRNWVKAFTEIPGWVKEAGIEFTKEELDGYLGGNVFRLFSLEGKVQKS